MIQSERGKDKKETELEKRNRKRVSNIITTKLA